MKKVLQLELEYAAFMVLIVLVRHVITSESYSFQWSARALAIKLNKESVGKNPNFFIEATALHHGLSVFSKALGMLGITMVQIYSKKVFLLDEFFNVPSRMRGYKMVFNAPIGGMPSSESNAENAILEKIVFIRDRILLIFKYEPSAYICASVIFAELVMVTHHGFPSPTPQPHPTRCSSSLGKRQLINIRKQIVDDVSSYYEPSNALFYLEGALETAKKRCTGEKVDDEDDDVSDVRDDTLNIERNIENEIAAEEERQTRGSDAESDDNEEVVAVLNTIRSRKVTFTAEEIADVLKVYDAVKK